MPLWIRVYSWLLRMVDFMVLIRSGSIGLLMWCGAEMRFLGLLFFPFFQHFCCCLSCLFELFKLFKLLLLLFFFFFFFFFFLLPSSFFFLCHRLTLCYFLTRSKSPVTRLSLPSVKSEEKTCGKGFKKDAFRQKMEEKVGTPRLCAMQLAIPSKKPTPHTAFPGSCSCSSLRVRFSHTFLRSSEPVESSQHPGCPRARQNLGGQSSTP